LAADGKLQVAGFSAALQLRAADPGGRRAPPEQAAVQGRAPESDGRCFRPPRPGPAPGGRAPPAQPGVRCHASGSEGHYWCFRSNPNAASGGRRERAARTAGQGFVPGSANCLSPSPEAAAGSGPRARWTSSYPAAMRSGSARRHACPARRLPCAHPGGRPAPLPDAHYPGCSARHRACDSRVRRRASSRNGFPGCSRTHGGTARLSDAPGYVARRPAC
jgi:hypothetical protein